MQSPPEGGIRKTITDSTQCCSGILVKQHKENTRQEHQQKMLNNLGSQPCRKTQRKRMREWLKSSERPPAVVNPSFLWRCSEEGLPQMGSCQERPKRPRHRAGGAGESQLITKKLETSRWESLDGPNCSWSCEPRGLRATPLQRLQGAGSAAHW